VRRARDPPARGIGVQLRGQQRELVHLHVGVGEQSQSAPHAGREQLRLTDDLGVPELDDRQIRQCASELLPSAKVRRDQSDDLLGNGRELD
jgi:hypothetical protein